MALAAASSTVGLTTPVAAASRPWILWINGVDHIRDCPLESIEIDDAGGGSPASMRFILDDEANSFAAAIPTQAFVQLYSSVADEFAFQGWIKTIRPQIQANYARWSCEAVDLSSMLDYGFIANENRPIESDQARIQYLLGNLGYYPPFTQAGTIGLLNAALQTTTYAKETPRSALERILAAAGATADYHVDPNNGALYTYLGSSGQTAPFAITDASVLSGGQAAGHVGYERDGSGEIDAVYVNGATPAGSGLFWGASAPHSPPLIGYLDAPDCRDAVTAAAMAAAEINLRGSVSPTEIIVEGFDGWRRGQTVNVTSTVLGWVAKPLVIKGVTTTIRSGTGIRRYVLTCAFEARRFTRTMATLETLARGVKAGTKVAGAVGGSTSSAPPVSTAYAAVQLTQNGIEVTDAASHLRVTLGNIPGGDWGLQVWSSDGTTVIIDGTSDMFRIAFSGTQSLTIATNTMGANTDTTIGALGSNNTSTPATLSFLSTSSAANANRHLSVLYDALGPSTLWAAGTSGGTPNQIFVGLLLIGEAHANIGSGQVHVVLAAHNQSGSTVTFQNRFYILAQVAI